ncbi:MAG TPA: hypothetical protein DD405_05895 [Desulfobacteraceae bacterium]|nr:hypothetical protein [Desulfobacteraceae bacterium]
MSLKIKIFFALLMLTALMFGFAHLFFPEVRYNFERLHIFLFNLCSGGTIIIYFSERKKGLSAKALIFLFLALCYAGFTFMEIYIPAMIISIILALIVESVRIRLFSLLPVQFFKNNEPVSAKFHQASLLCLSCGLIISCGVILNNEYLHFVSMPKLKLDTFFLGFSFPVSLIAMSVIFSFMKEETGVVFSALKKTGFWAINLGVIIFFIFILFEKLFLQAIIALILFFAVIMIFYLYYLLANALQQKFFLTSGVGFLIVTAVTGIAYIIIEFMPTYDHEHLKWLLWLHTFASLYGWNLCGLVVICRFDDFPVKLHSLPVIILHWITMLIFAPMGKFYGIFALLTLICYASILYFILFSKKAGTICRPKSVTKLLFSL